MFKKIIHHPLRVSLFSLVLHTTAFAASPYTYTVSPASLPATMVQGSDSIPVTITVTNTSPVAYGLGAPTVGSDNNWKELTNSCDIKVALASGASCTITGS